MYKTISSYNYLKLLQNISDCEHIIILRGYCLAKRSIISSKLSTAEFAQLCAIMQTAKNALIYLPRFGAAYQYNNPR